MTEMIATRQAYGDALVEFGEKKQGHCGSGCGSFKIHHHRKIRQEVSRQVL